jgi:anthranilate phosphoribosyltransferase
VNENVIKEGVQKLVKGVDLTYHESKGIMKEVMLGRATKAQIGAFLTALRMKGETIQEISAFAGVMRQFCHRISPNVKGRLVDTCGTGGDRVKTFNVSTVSAFVVAGAGVAIAKHGNRSVTSKCGSADVLEKVGLNLNLEPKGVERTIEKVGIGFMFAPKFHPAMKFAVGPRREIGIQTVFNILGPLTNPAGAKFQVLGVFSEELVSPLAYTLRELGSEEAMVVHGVDGLDEISIIGRTSVAWLKDGNVSFMSITPEELGFRTASSEEISEISPEKSAELTFKLLNNIAKVKNARRDMVLMNAAAGIMVGGLADDLSQAVDLAVESIESGAAYKKMKMMIEASGGQLSYLGELETKFA